MKPVKIITHPGVFHADEVFTIGLLFEVFGESPVVRTRTLTQEDINDKDVWILDLGGIYSPSRHVFDHHQNESLPATNYIVLQYLYGTGTISIEVFDELKKNFNHISEIDKGSFGNMEGFQVNDLIKTFNYIKGGFEKAIEVARGYVRGCMDTVNRMAESKVLWDQAVKLPNVKICKDFPILWKRYDEEMFLINPTDKEDQSGKVWNLHTRDCRNFPIVAQGNEIFIHTMKFLAVYECIEDAVRAATMSNVQKV